MVIKDELAELKRKYGDDRKTRIQADANRELTAEDLVAAEDVVVTLSQRGYIKRQQIGTFRSQRRGGKGKLAMITREEDAVRHLLVANTHDYILFFTNRGRVFITRVHTLPEASRQAKGLPIINLPGVQVDSGEYVSAIVTLPQFEPDHYMVMATKGGMIKKTSLAEYAKIRANGLIAISLVDGDELRWVGLTDGQDDIILATRKGQAARFHEHEVRPMGRDTRGVTGIRLRDGRRGHRHGDRRSPKRAAGRHRAGLRQAHAARRVSRETSGHRRRDRQLAQRRHGRRRRRARGGPRGRGDDAHHRGGHHPAHRGLQREPVPARVAWRDGHEAGRGRSYRGHRRLRGRPAARAGRPRSEQSRTAWPADRATARPRQPVESKPGDRSQEIAVYADEFSIYAGNANRPLAEKICRYLRTHMGEVEVFQFSNENIFVRVMENVREQDVFLVQPTCRPVNQSIMELLIMIDAFKRASAGRITAVMPYYSYGRSDKKDQPRVPITARLVADMLTVAGADRVLTMDLHQGQIQGFFSIPVDELTAVDILCRYIQDKDLPDVVVVAELGFAKKARNFAEKLAAPLAIVEKRRLGNEDKTELMNVIGEVEGKTAVIIDDEIDTAGSLMEAVSALVADGAREVYSCATHGVFSRRWPSTGSPPARSRRSSSPTPSRCRRARRATASRSCPSPPCSARRSSASTAARASAPSSPRRCSWWRR